MMLFGSFSAVGFHFRMLLVMECLCDLLKLIKTSFKLPDASELKFLTRKVCFLCYTRMLQCFDPETVGEACMLMNNMG